MKSACYLQILYNTYFYNERPFHVPEICRVLLHIGCVIREISCFSHSPAPVKGSLYACNVFSITGRIAPNSCVSHRIDVDLRLVNAGAIRPLVIVYLGVGIKPGIACRSNSNHGPDMSVPVLWSARHRENILCHFSFSTNRAFPLYISLAGYQW